MLTGYDGASAPDIAAVKAAGGILVPCYLVGPYAVAPQRGVELRAEGLGAFYNWERQPDFLTNCGVPGGVDAASDAITAILGQGVPADGTIGIAYSVDVEVDPTNYHLVGDAFSGINQEHAGRFLAKVYGQGGLIDYLTSQNLVHPCQWLSSSSSFPGYNIASPNVGMYQLVESDIPNTDKNILTYPSMLNAWWPEGSPYITGSGEMTSSEQAWINAKFNGTLERVVEIDADVKKTLTLVEEILANQPKYATAIEKEGQAHARNGAVWTVEQTQKMLDAAVKTLTVANASLATTLIDPATTGGTKS